MSRVYLDSQYKDWILGGIIRESTAASVHKFEIFHISIARISLQNLRSRLLNKKIEFKSGDIIVNQGTLFSLINQDRINLSSLRALRCYFTHDSKANLLKYKNILTQLELIFVMNRQDSELLMEVGVKRSKIRIIYGAIDHKIFFPSKTTPDNDEYIYVTGDAKGRKNPGKVVELIQSSPEFHFKINGRFWIDYLRKNNIQLENAEVLNFDLKKNPELMRNASCFLSLSLHEGGPYPVMEALASGTPVVSTPTGWTPELVSAKNGCIVAFDISIPELKSILKKVMKLKNQVHHLDLTNGEFSWEKLATLLYGR